MQREKSVSTLSQGKQISQEHLHRMLARIFGLLFGSIFGGTFGRDGFLGIDGFDTLHMHASSNAIHNSSEYRESHDYTAQQIYERIVYQIKQGDNNCFGHSIIWLDGLEGSGKSVMAHRIAEHCAASGRLLGSFFFSKSDPTRNNASAFVATLAYQIASLTPDHRHLVVAAINSDPSIFEGSLEEQFLVLIQYPLMLYHQCRFSDKPARVIVIDGITECEDNHAQTEILRIISIITFYNRHSQVHLQIVVSSHLEHGLLPDLVSSGAFPMSPYQDSTIKISMPGPYYDSRPKQEYPSLLDDDSESLSMLDAYYTRVLTRSPDVERVVDVLSAVMNLQYLNRLSSSFLEDFMGLKRGDIPVIFSDLTSIIRLDDEGIPTAIDPSFEDFIRDQTRSQNLSINTPQRHAYLLRRFFIILREWQEDPRIPSDPFSLSGYATSMLPSTMLNLCQEDATLDLIRTEIINFSFKPIFRHHNATNMLEFLDGYLTCLERLSSRLYQTTLDLLHKQFKSDVEQYYGDPDLTFVLASIGEHKYIPHPASKIARLGRVQLRIDTNALKLFDKIRSELFNTLSGQDPVGSYIRRLATFLTSTELSGIPALDGSRYATAALVCLKYLCCFSRHPPPKPISKRGRLVRRNLPWMWRHKIRKDKSSPPCPPIPPNSIRYKDFGPRFIEYMDSLDKNHPRRKEGTFPHFTEYAMDLLPIFLRKSTYSRKLVVFANERVFYDYCNEEPEKRDAAQEAIAQYLKLHDPQRKDTIL